MSPIHLGYLKHLDCRTAAKQTVRVEFVSDGKKQNPTFPSGGAK